jgi:hypothetical protein
VGVIEEVAAHHEERYRRPRLGGAPGETREKRFTAVDRAKREPVSASSASLLDVVRVGAEQADLEACFLEARSRLLAEDEEHEEVDAGDEHERRAEDRNQRAVQGVDQ